MANNMSGCFFLKRGVQFWPNRVPVLNWIYQLSEVVVYNSHKMVVPGTLCEVVCVCVCDIC